MKKYRKKPIVIEAEQWFPDKEIEGLMIDGYEDENGKDCFYPHPYIETLEGRMFVSKGDWIITGINGEKYPCKPEIFKKTYDIVEEDKCN